MKHVLNTHRDLMDSLLILILSGLITGLYCTSHLDLNSVTSYSHALVSALVIPDNPGQYFIQQSLIHLILCLVIFSLGLSLIGIPLIQFCVFLKGFQIGFSSALFLYTYQLKGILGIVLTLVPQMIFDLAAICLVSGSAIEMSSQLLFMIINHSSKVKFSELFNEKLNQFLFSSLLVLISSTLKSTIGLKLIELFTHLE